MIDYNEWKAQADKDVEYIDCLITTPRNSEPGKLWQDLDSLTQWLARSGELTAEGQSFYESGLGAMIEQIAKENKEMSISGIRDIARGRCSDILLMYRRIERQNAALTHAIDAVRSLLSFTKEQMRLTPNN